MEVKYCNIGIREVAQSAEIAPFFFTDYSVGIPFDIRTNKGKQTCHLARVHRAMLPPLQVDSAPLKHAIDLV